MVRAGAAPLVSALALALPAGAQAARVLVMGPGGHVTASQDQFVPSVAPTPAPNAVRANVVVARAARTRKPPQKTVVSELKRLLNSGAINSSQYATYSSSFNAALTAERRLRGTRATELEAVITNLHNIATAGKLTPGRLPVLFQTLDRNREWWTTGPLLTAGQYVEFSDSQLLWEYYAGQGIELQVLGSFGKADGLYTAGPADYPQMEALLSQIIPLAVNRAGGLVWEYYFQFDGGRPPWTSAMSQGTGIEALTRAYLASHQSSYLQLAHEALPVFSAPPPVGVRVPTALGAWYVQYTFEPSTLILNAFLQSLIGLYDYAKLSGNQQAMQLFAAGNAQAEAELPRFDTGAWSLYQPGVEDDMNYPELVTGFLDQLCSRTSAPVYCTTAQHFHAYLKTPPVLSLLTTQAVGKQRFNLRLSL